MIYDLQSELLSYEGLNKHIRTVHDFMLNNNLESIKEPKTIISGSNVFALRFDYSTKNESECLWESHNVYLDLHIVLKGSEKVFFNHKSKMIKDGEYVSENDYQLFKGNGQNITLNTGDFILFFTNDVHKTSVMLKDSEYVDKVVFKIKI